MTNYLTAQTFTVGKFGIEIHPYIAVPANVFEANCALQYGADFKTTFTRSAPQTSKIGLVQLILPRTQLFPQTQVGAWNVDKRAPAGTFAMVRCLYGEDNVTIGTHSEFYQGKAMRAFTTTSCFLIDTPREINATFANGTFSGVTDTKFANYVVDLETGKAFDQGMVWGYKVVQDSANKTKFRMDIVAPKACALRSTNEHLDAIARFLATDRNGVKALIAG